MADVETLSAEARTHFGPGARVEALVPLAGGASRELHGFDVLVDAERIELVLRADPEGLEEPEARAREFAVLRTAHEAGVAVPTPHWLTAGSTGIVMQRLEGEAIARRILRDERFATARERLVDDVARAAAGIHAAPVPDGLEVMGAAAAVEDLQQRLEAYGEPHPALELGLRWCREHLPPEREPVLVHGDLRLGNLMVDEGGLVGVLDWELSHAGDPVEDLGWMCLRAWRFGHDGQPALGLGSREQLLGAYAAAGGGEVTLDELRFWEILGNVRWGVICVMQAQRGGLEHLTIGRRACEPEWDLLGLLGAAPAADDEPFGGAPQDSPDAHELLAAVAQHLATLEAPREQRFGLRVAANACAIVAREIAPAAPSREDMARLAAAVRAGEDVFEQVRASVRDKVAVARPGYAAFVDPS